LLFCFGCYMTRINVLTVGPELVGQRIPIPSEGNQPNVCVPSVYELFAGGPSEAIQTMPLACIDDFFAPWGGPSGGDGDSYLIAAYVSVMTSSLGELTCIVPNGQEGSGPGGISLAIYDRTNRLLARTNIATPVAGVMRLPLAVGAGLSLSPGLYYLGVFCNRNATAISRRVATGATGTTPPLGYRIPNALPNGAAGWPADASAWASNLTGQRPWIGGVSA